MANDLGNTITALYNNMSTGDPLYKTLSSSFWVAPVYLDASNDQNFTSWSAYFGPSAENRDLFSTTVRTSMGLDLAKANYHRHAKTSLAPSMTDLLQTMVLPRMDSLTAQPPHPSPLRPKTS